MKYRVTRIIEADDSWSADSLLRVYRAEARCSGNDPKTDEDSVKVEPVSEEIAAEEGWSR